MRDFPFDIYAGLLNSRSLEIMRKSRDIGLLQLGETGGWRADCGVYRAAHQRIGILRKDFMIKKIVVVEEEEIAGKTIVTLHGRSVDLGNAGIEQTVSGANHDGPLITD